VQGEKRNVEKKGVQRGRSKKHWSDKRFLLTVTSKELAVVGEGEES